LLALKEGTDRQRVVLEEVTTPELVLEESYSSGDLTAQNVVCIRFRRVDHGAPNVRFVVR
jgi:hypothetical protein